MSDLDLLVAGGTLVGPAGRRRASVGVLDGRVTWVGPPEADAPSAAASGVTTIVEHTHGAPVRTVEDLRDKAGYLADRSEVDFGLAAHAWPGLGQDVGGLWAAGVTFFKVFTCTTHGVPGHDAAR